MNARRWLISLQLWARVAVGFVLATLVFTAVGCTSDSTSDRSGDASKRSGAAIYRTKCAACHGSDLRGTNRGPSQFSQVYEPTHHPDESYRSAIANGVTAHHWNFGDMKPIAGLDDAEIDAVIAYIRSQQAEHGFEQYPPR